MSGYLHLNTTLDVENGERVEVHRASDCARVEVYTDAGDVQTYLTALQCRALAALLLITAEECEPRRNLASFEDMP